MPRGTAQRTLGPSAGQARSRPFSSEEPSLLGPRYPDQSAARAKTIDKVTKSAMSPVLAFISVLPVGPPPGFDIMPMAGPPRDSSSAAGASDAPVAPPFVERYNVGGSAGRPQADGA